MGFRNPVTTATDPTARAAAAAAQTTASQAYDQAFNGIVPGSRLAADAIDGKTITGATIRTAAAGRRWVLDGTVVDSLRGFTGDPAEASSGLVQIGLSAGATTAKDRGLVTIAPPLVGAVGGASTTALTGYARTRDASSAGFWSIAGDVLVPDAGTDPASVARRDYVDALSKILIRPESGTYAPSSTAITSGGARESGTGTDPALNPFTLARASRVVFLAGFRTGPTSAGVGVALPSIKVDGAAVSFASGVQRTNDETQLVFGWADLAAGAHTPSLRVDAFGGAVTWTSAWLAMLCGLAG